jgi:hypothetical protein
MRVHVYYERKLFAMSLTDVDADIARQRAVTDAAMGFIWENTVRPLVTDEVIEEHRGNPFGRHSPALDMVLGFLRNDPLRMSPRLVVVILRPEEQWAIGDVSREVGVPVHVRPDVYYSVEEIEHAIFRERLAAVQVAFGAADPAIATD